MKALRFAVLLPLMLGSGCVSTGFISDIGGRPKMIVSEDPFRGIVTKSPSTADWKWRTSMREREAEKKAIEKDSPYAVLR